ncbi:MAG: hypothetical protein ACRDNB_11895 [Gaiellaceae bacterium]
MWSRRRTPAEPPVILPSLDRLAGLIERVVELVDAVGGTTVPSPEPVPEPAREPEPAAAAGGEEWLAFVPSPHGYRLLERRGSRPAPRDVVELEEARYRVLRLAASPLPGDGRRCAYLEREEPPVEDRSFDA